MPSNLQRILSKERLVFFGKVIALILAIFGIGFLLSLFFSSLFTAGWR